MRVLVCGSRFYEDREHLFRYLDTLHAMTPFSQVIEGGAKGADRLARDWANTNGVPVRTFEADWDEHGKAAGPIRNRQMLKEGDPELVVAFFLEESSGSRGTFDMVRVAKRARVDVRIASGMERYVEMSRSAILRGGTIP